MQLPDPGIDITELAQDNSRGLVCYRSVIKAGVAGQYLAGPGQCLLRAGQSQRQQVIDSVPRGHPRVGFPCHAVDFRPPHSNGLTVTWRINPALRHLVWLIMRAR